MTTTNTALMQDSLLESLGGKPEEELQSNTKELELPSSHHSTGITSSTEERAISLLGNGVPSESVAAALGVTPARISQLLSNKQFADRVAELRYQNLQEHNARDDKYDTLEDKLLKKLDEKLPLLIRPESVLSAIKIVNAAKRRGQSAPEQVTNNQNIVSVVLPTVIAEKFTINIHNQVTRAGEQELLTIPSGNLLKQVEAAEEVRLLELEKKEAEIQREEESTNVIQEERN